MLLRSMREAGVMINLIISSIQSLLGTYIFEGFALGLTFLETQLAISLFCNQLKKRYGFVIRILMMLPACIIIAYLLAILNTEVPSLFVRVTCYLLIDLLNLLFLVVCWKGRLEELLLAFSSGLAAYQVGNKFYPLLQNLNGINDRETLSLVHSGSSGNGFSSLRSESVFMFFWRWLSVRKIALRKTSGSGGTSCLYP